MVATERHGWTKGANEDVYSCTWLLDFHSHPGTTRAQIGSRQRTNRGSRHRSRRETFGELGAAPRPGDEARRDRRGREIYQFKPAHGYRDTSSAFFRREPVRSLRRAACRLRRFVHQAPSGTNESLVDRCQGHLLEFVTYGRRYSSFHGRRTACRQWRRADRDREPGGELVAGIQGWQRVRRRICILMVRF